MLADDYALTHTPVFRHSGDAQPRKGNSDNLPSGGYLFGRAHDSQVAQPATIVRKRACHSCLNVECCRRKNQRVEPDCLIAPNTVG